MLKTAIQSFVFGTSLGAFIMFGLTNYQMNQEHFQDQAIFDIAENIAEQVQGKTQIPAASMRYMKPMLSAEAEREVAEIKNVPVPKRKPYTKGIGYSKQFRNQMTSLIQSAYADEGGHD